MSDASRHDRHNEWYEQIWRERLKCRPAAGDPDCWHEDEDDADEDE